MNSWNVTIREIIILSVPIFLVMVIGLIFQIPPETVGSVAGVVAIIVGLPLELYVRGYIHWKLLKKLIPMEHREGD